MKFFKVIRKTVYESDYRTGLQKDEFVQRQDLYISDVLKMEQSDCGTRTDVFIRCFFGLYRINILRYYRLCSRNGRMKIVLAYRRVKKFRDSTLAELVQTPV